MSTEPVLATEGWLQPSCRLTSPVLSSRSRDCSAIVFFFFFFFFLMIRRPRSSTLFPSTTLFRSNLVKGTEHIPGEPPNLVTLPVDDPHLRDGKGTSVGGRIEPQRHDWCIRQGKSIGKALMGRRDGPTERIELIKALGCIIPYLDEVCLV